MYYFDQDMTVQLLPDATFDTEDLKYPDPNHRWDMRSFPVKGKVSKAAILKEQVGKHTAPTPPLRPLGKNLMVDKKGIIWYQRKPVGIWGIDGGEMHEGLRGLR
ncbi:MAG: hypothetical protein WCB27_09605 [Thermoguttaceae bacterium]